MTMQLLGLFKPSHNELEKGGRMPVPPGDAMMVQTKACPSCGRRIPLQELWENLWVCPCGYHFRINARQRIKYITDAGSFQELDEGLESTDRLQFPGYEEKLENSRLACREKEAVIGGTAAIGGHRCALFVMEPRFMMGSMGTVVGEKLTRLFEYARDHRLPVVGYTVSGGARMQEGILSLMQMAKVSGAVKRHSDAGLFYLPVLTDPTTGGVTASFAMDGDILVAEPGAMIGFAGARVIEQTTNKKLPDGFQRAEFLLEHGFVDLILPRKEQKKTIAALLAVHAWNRPAAEERQAKV